MPADFHGAFVNPVVHAGHVLIVKMLDFEVNGPWHRHPRVVDTIPDLDQEILLHFQPSAPRDSHFALVDLRDGVSIRLPETIC